MVYGVDDGRHFRTYFFPTLHALVRHWTPRCCPVTTTAVAATVIAAVVLAWMDGRAVVPIEHYPGHIRCDEARSVDDHIEYSEQAWCRHDPMRRAMSAYCRNRS